MGKTEDVIMEYLSQPDIIADLFNGYVFCGEQIIQPDMLREVDSKGRLLLEDGKGQKHTYEVIKKERDIVREVTINNKKLRLMICGVEQQTNVDYSMPLRVLAYDTLEYLKQAKQIEQEHKRKKDVSGKEFLSMFTKEDKLTPTITIVFYTGKESWDGAMDLDGLFENLEGLELLLPYMVKAPLNVLHLYDVKNTYRYRSSLKKIFDLMPFTEDGNALKQYVNKHEEVYSHIDSAASRVLSLLLDLDLSVQSRDEERKGENNVCEAIRQIKEEGRMEGRAEGKAEGKAEGMALAYNEMGLSPEEIAERIGITLQEVEKYLSQLQ